jgi:hypothetical protein
MPDVVKFIDRGDLKALNKTFRAHEDGKVLRKEFTDGARAILRPVVREVKAGYRAAPSMGHEFSSRGSRGRPDLRALLAKATHLEVRLAGKFAGVRIRVDGRRMPDKMKSLPQYWEGFEPGRGKARWRHPVFGDRDTWVQQRPHRTATAIFTRQEPGMVQRMNEVFGAVARKLERGA